MTANQLPDQRNSLLVRNRQRAIRLDSRLLRWMTRHLLEELIDAKGYDLCVTVISDREMTRINEKYLQHAGTTDVVTFDYNDPGQVGRISGEIFVSAEEAVTQAQKFRTTWQSELTRYVVHGILHLSGFDDLTPDKRKEMKKAENRFLKQLEKDFRISKLAGPLGASRKA